MNTFSIRDIENLCEIKAHTLRVWEQRYRFHQPKRKAGNHRLYDSEDLKHLLRIAFLYHHGHKPSALARLSKEELGELTHQVPFSQTSHEIFINRLLQTSLDYEHDAFDLVLRDIILHLGFEQAIARVIFPFLTRIGRLWLSGHLIPAQEHFVSALITQKLLAAIDELDPPPPALPGGRQILLYTPQGEFHEMPLLFMRYLMKKYDQPVIYFGSNIGLEALQQYCAVKPVSHLYFHLVTRLIDCSPEQYVRRLLDTFPDKILVFSGKPGASLCDRFPRLRVLRNQEEMEAFARGH